MKNLKLVSRFPFVKVLIGLILVSAAGCDDTALDEPLIPDPVADSNQFTVDKLGGVFVLPSGIEVTIPEGAVNEPKDIRIHNLSLNEVNVLAAVNNSENSAFLSGISVATNMFNFKKPVKIKIPVLNIDEKDLAVLYEKKSGSNMWKFSDETITVSQQNNFIEIILKESGLENTANKTKSEFSFNDIRNFLLKSYGDILLSEDSCRKIGYTIDTKDIDNASGEGCDGTKVYQEITYWGCDPPQKGTYVGLSFSPLCVPELKISPEGPLKLKKDNTQSVTVTASISNFPLSDQEIKLASNNNLLITTPIIFTGSNGIGSFNVKGLEIGEGLINLSFSSDYYLTTIYSNDGELTEYNEFDQMNVKQDYSINVTVYDLMIEIVSGNDQTGVFFEDQPPQALAEPLKVKVTDDKGEPLQSATVLFEVVKGGGTVSNATAETDENGLAETFYTIGNEDEEQIIEVVIQKVAGEIIEDPPAPIEFKATSIDLSGLWLVKSTSSNCPPGPEDEPYRTWAHMRFNSNNHTMTFPYVYGTAILLNNWEFSLPDRKLTIRINYTENEEYYCDQEGEEPPYQTVVSGEVRLTGSYSNKMFTGSYTEISREAPINPCAVNYTCSGSFKMTKK